MVWQRCHTMVKPVDTFDPYTGLIHLAGLDPDTSPPWEPARWHDKQAGRRLQAYRILASYMTNSARFNRTRLTTRAQREIREYGDPSLIRDRIVAGVLGAGAIFTVEGAERPPLELPQLPPRPGPSDTGVPEADSILDAAAEAAYTARAVEIAQEWADAHETHGPLAERQEWLDRWIEDEQVISAMYEVESDGVVPLGDGILTLGWSAEKQRPTVTVWEPDAYHPVLDDVEVNAFPEKIHLAWEVEDDDGESSLHRITYELVDLADVGDGAETTRDYPWNDGPSSTTCVQTYKVWSLKTTGVKWPTLDDLEGVIQVNADGMELDALDLEIDFLPVIHIPNTPSAAHHFGTSSITAVAQMLDDLASTDTDITKASALAGNPTLGAAGVNVSGLTLRPGSIIPLPPEGRLFPIDFSGPLVSLQSLLETMLDRLAVNSQVPGVVLGRISGQDVPSGVALSLSFAPFEQLVAVLRLTRFVKYQLLVKFAQRLAQQHGDLEPGPTPRVRIEFATTVPTDLAATVTQVARLVEGNVIPTQVALAVLREAGFYDIDIEEALALVQAEDTAGAVEIANALGSEQAAADYLGIDLPGPPDTGAPVDTGGPEPVPGEPGALDDPADNDSGLPGPL